MASTITSEYTNPSNPSTLENYDGSYPCDDSDDDRDRDNDDHDDDDYSFSDPDENDIPEWLLDAPLYLKVSIITSFLTFLISVVFVATGMAITVYTGGFPGLKNTVSTFESLEITGSMDFSLMPSNFPSSSPSASPTTTPFPTFYPTISIQPSPAPSFLPTLYPSIFPSQSPFTPPSSMPTTYPSFLPSDIASDSPSKLPSAFPSLFPTTYPTVSHIPTPVPSAAPFTPPSSFPSLVPSSFPSIIPSSLPSSQPTQSPTISHKPTVTSMPSHSPSAPSISSFYAMGERYSGDWTELQASLKNLNEGEFLVHLGDFNSGSCSSNSFSQFRNVLAASSVPVFLTVGEEEWNECSSSRRGRQYAMNNWRNVFRNFYNRWTRNPLMQEINTNGQQSEFWSFILRDILFIGVQVVGGSKWNETKPENSGTDWDDHLKASYEWFETSVYYKSGRYHHIVLMGNEENSKSSSRTRYFFRKMEDLVDDLEIPTLYVYEGSRNRLKEEDDFFWSMEVEGDEFPIVQINVDTLNNKKPFSFND